MMGQTDYKFPFPKRVATTPIPVELVASLIQEMKAYVGASK